MITRDFECPWHYYCIICSYDVTGADFENLPYAFGQSEKSSLYDNCYYLSNQEGMITWCWLAEQACINWISKRIASEFDANANVRERKPTCNKAQTFRGKPKRFFHEKCINSQSENSLSGDSWCFWKFEVTVLHGCQIKSWFSLLSLVSISDHLIRVISKQC